MNEQTESLRKTHQKLADRNGEIEMTRTPAGSGRKSPPFVVPGWIDDYGLKPSEFRVLAHVARRCGDKDKGGSCYESLPKMAKICGLRRATIQAALKYLECVGFITKQERSGQSTIYRNNGMLHP